MVGVLLRSRYLSPIRPAAQRMGYRCIQINNTQYARSVSCTGPVTQIIVDCETSTVPYALILTCYPSCGLLMSHNICFSTKWPTIFSHRTCYHHYCQLRPFQTQTFCNPLNGLCIVCYPVRPVSNYVLYIVLLTCNYLYDLLLPLPCPDLLHNFYCVYYFSY